MKSLKIIFTVFLLTSFFMGCSDGSSSPAPVYPWAFGTTPSNPVDTGRTISLSSVSGEANTIRLTITGANWKSDIGNRKTDLANYIFKWEPISGNLTFIDSLDWTITRESDTVLKIAFSKSFFTIGTGNVSIDANASTYMLLVTTAPVFSPWTIKSNTPVFIEII